MKNFVNDLVAPVAVMCFKDLAIKDWSAICRNCITSCWKGKRNNMLFSKKKTNEPDLGFSWLQADMHSHLIPGIDDGAPDMATSIELVKGLTELGYKKLVTTPHILWDMYPNSAEKIAAGLDKLKQAVAAEG